jgi:phenylalanyl-tRNA synthetase beta chain
MKVSLSWLKDYVSIELEPKALADALTMAGLEVEAMWDRYDYLDRVLVSRVEQVLPHPNADKLTCCTVNTGDGTVSVVCGAPNVQPDMLVPLALPGTILPNGMEIRQSAIRGQVSQGMLCSEVELALGEDASGIMSLSQDTPPGTPLNRALKLSDTVFEIGLTPNRPDCASIIGIAREVAAIQKTKIRYPKYPLPETLGSISTLAAVTIEAPDLCPRYAAKLVKDIKISESPAWLKDRLLSVGQRPINNIVDITNFIMLETGQPLHAFDFNFLDGGRIVVRTAREGEPFTTLDSKKRSLSEEMLLICDEKKPIAIAGVMGGENSEIQDNTSTVLIESAYFDPVSVRKTSKQLGLSTDASYRFERGIDPHGTINSLMRAAELMVQVSGGTSVAGIIDVHPKPAPSRCLPLSVRATNRLLGTDISGETIVDLLESIEIFRDQKTVPGNEDIIEFRPPSYRVDLARPEDLIEEVARLYGYERIPTTLPVMATSEGRTGTVTPRNLRERCRNKMIGYGFSEAINYSFIHSNGSSKLRLPEDDPRYNVVPLLNPLTEDQAVMRTSLLPGLLETMFRNLSKQIKTLRIFEIGKTFLVHGKEELPNEQEILAALWTGDRMAPSWGNQSTSCDFYDIKGVVTALLGDLNLKDFVYSKESASFGPYLRPGHSAGITIAGKSVGLVGEVHPEVLSAFNLKQSAFVFELFFDHLTGFLPKHKKVSGISKYPSVARDVTLIVDKELEAHQLLDQVKQMETTFVEDVQLFDVFDGGTLPEAKKSVSFRITYRSADQTLEDESVNRIHTAICEQIIKTFKADLP